MRVVHVTFDMRIGGTEMVIKNIIEGNSDANIEMSIYCIEAPLGPWGEDLKASGTPIAVEERQPGFDRSLISKTYQRQRYRYFALSSVYALGLRHFSRGFYKN